MSKFCVRVTESKICVYLSVLKLKKKFRDSNMQRFKGATLVNPILCTKIKSKPILTNCSIQTQNIGQACGEVNDSYPKRTLHPKEGRDQGEGRVVL